MDIERAICHEAGHAVAALHFGFRVERIEVFRGVPRSLVALECTRQAMIVLAGGGIAAEQLIFGNYDADTCADDQRKISECGGGAIESLVAEALSVIRSHEDCLERLRKQLTQEWVVRQAESEAADNFNADSDSLTFELLSHEELGAVCPEVAKMRPPQAERNR